MKKLQIAFFGFILSASQLWGADSIIVIHLKKWKEPISVSPILASIWYEKPQTFQIQRKLDRPMLFMAAGAKLRIHGNFVTVIPLNVGNCHLRIMDSLTGKTLKHLTWNIKYIPDGFISINGVGGDSVVERLTLMQHGQLEYVLDKHHTGIVDTFCMMVPDVKKNTLDTLWSFSAHLTPAMKKYISTCSAGTALIFSNIRVSIYPARVRREVNDLRVIVLNSRPYQFGG